MKENTEQVSAPHTLALHGGPAQTNQSLLSSTVNPPIPFQIPLTLILFPFFSPTASLLTSYLLTSFHLTLLRLFPPLAASCSLTRVISDPSLSFTP